MRGGPCAGHSGQCLALEVHSGTSGLSTIDQISVSSSELALPITLSPPTPRTEHLPVVVPLYVDSTASFSLSVGALLGGDTEASAEVGPITLAPGEHRTVSVELGSSFVDMGVIDASGGDLAGADLSMTLPDLKNADLETAPTSWTAVDVGAISVGDLYGVWGRGASEIWIVGSGGTVLRTMDAGVHWSSLTAFTTKSLRGIWGNANEVDVVGDTSTIFQTTDNVTFHDLHPHIAPDLGSGPDFFGVTGVGNDRYVVGDRYVLYSPDSGATFTAVEDNSSYELTSVVARSASEIYVGGYYTPTFDTPFVLRSSGGSSAFAQETIPSSIDTRIDALWTSATDLYAVGGGASKTVVWRKNSQSVWSIEPTGPSSSPWDFDLHAVWGTGTGPVWAAGSFGYIIYSPGDGTWVEQDNDAPSTLTGLWGSSATDVYCVGWQTTIQHLHP